jgi:type VI protein secretion system component VasF
MTGIPHKRMATEHALSTALKSNTANYLEAQRYKKLFWWVFACQMISFIVMGFLIFGR